MPSPLKSLAGIRPRFATIPAYITKASRNAPPATQTSPLRDQKRVVMLHGGRREGFISHLGLNEDRRNISDGLF